ncbi:MAG TPA: hypothetical protein VK615_15610 [Candidatus Binatia bacterium]|nr:hypothetical protein [Candidatus Binatia bacterium]
MSHSFSELMVLSTLSHLSEEALWASHLAARLRLLQANFADDPPPTRQGYLHEEIDRAIKDVTPTKRRSHLEALKQKFPSWEASEGANSVEPTPAAPSIDTPEEALRKLLELSGDITPEAKAAFTRKLQAAGFGVSQAAGGLSEISPETQKKLGLTPGQQLHPDRAIKLLVGLAEMVLALDQLVWTLWKQRNPKASFRKDRDLAKLIGPYLSGDTEISTPVIADPLDKTRALIAALLGAVGRGAANFAAKHVARIGPEAIEDLAKLERSFMQSLEVTSWKKYRELFNEYCNETALEAEIEQAILKVAETLVQNRGRGA